MNFIDSFSVSLMYLCVFLNFTPVLLNSSKHKKHLLNVCWIKLDHAIKPSHHKWRNPVPMRLSAQSHPARVRANKNIKFKSPDFSAPILCQATSSVGHSEIQWPKNTLVFLGPCCFWSWEIETILRKLLCRNVSKYLLNYKMIMLEKTLEKNILVSHMTKDLKTLSSFCILILPIMSVMNQTCYDTTAQNCFVRETPNTF
jgi:hypothetical protein